MRSPDWSACPSCSNGSAASYSLNFPTGIGFTGIAIALLGRNHPVGMVFSALLWAAWTSPRTRCRALGCPGRLVTIMQGIIVLSVVVAYEFVRRYRLMLEAKRRGRALAAKSKPAAESGAGVAP